MPKTGTKTCAVCNKAIPEDGWGKHAYRTDDGAHYIHHKCRPPAPEQPRDPVIPARAATPSDYLTLPDAAKLLGLSPSTLRRRIKNRTLPAFRLAGGQTILIERAAVLALLRPLNQ